MMNGTHLLRIVHPGAGGVIDDANDLSTPKIVRLAISTAP